MNNNNLEKFIENIESIKMTQYEKNEMRQRLSNFAVDYKPIVSPYSSILLLSRKIMVSAFIAIISIGSLSQFASNDALPGDTLYPVKIAHEKIRLAATNGEARKIDFEIRQTEKRIQEATQLAQEEKLDTETQEDIAEVIKGLTQKVKNHIEEVKVNDPESALILNSELKSTIKANSDVLRKVTTQRTTRKKETSPTENKETIITQESNIITDEVINLDIPSLDEIESTVIEDNNILDEIESMATENEEYEEVEISLAESLLGSLDQEVSQTEALQGLIEKQIIKEEVEREIIEEQEELESEKDIEDTEKETMMIQDPEEEEIIKEEVEREIIEEQEELESEKDIEDTEKETMMIQDPEEEEIIKEEVEREIIEKLESEKDIEDTRTAADQKIIDFESSVILNKEISSLQDIIKIKEDIATIKSTFKEKPETLVIENQLEENIFDENTLRKNAEILIKDKKYKQAFIQLQNILEHYQQEKMKDNAKKKLGIDQENNTKETLQTEIETTNLEV